MKRWWRWLFGPRPYGTAGKNFSSEADLSRYVWKRALMEDKPE